MVKRTKEIKQRLCNSSKGKHYDKYVTWQVSQYFRTKSSNVGALVVFTHKDVVPALCCDGLLSEYY